jgi:hypothetical protein
VFEKIIAVKDLRFEHQMLSNGQHLWSCWWRDYAGPVGLVWGTLYGSEGKICVSVTDAYVPEWARRQGVPRFMLAQGLKRADIVLTSSASTLAGRAAARTLGFTKIAGHYIFDKSVPLQPRGLWGRDA